MGKKTGSNFDELFFDNELVGGEGLTELRLSEIEPNADQPRKVFDKEALEQLAASIKENGVIQPLIVRPLSNGNYSIVAGERRWRAAKLAGLTEVPVVVREDIDDETAAKIALVENLQREDLNPMEEAQAYKELIDRYDMTQEQLAQALGKARSSIANTLGLLTLPSGVKELLRSGRLSAGHCKALKQIRDPALMTEAAQRAADGALSVREVEAIAKRESGKGSKGSAKSIKQRDSYFVEIEAALTEALGTKVEVKQKRRGGEVIISFSDKESLSEIMSRFNA